MVPVAPIAAVVHVLETFEGVLARERPGFRLPDTGEVQWTHRLPASTWATPLGNWGSVYFFTDQGITQVLRATATNPEVLSTNHLSVEAPVTGYAVVDGAIVIRAGKEVIRVGRDRSQSK